MYLSFGHTCCSFYTCVCLCVVVIMLIIRIIRRRQPTEVNDKVKSQKSICVITGPRGCGKTAMVSHWLQHEAQDAVAAGSVIVCHYAACDRMARNLEVFMRRCIAELRQAFSSKYGELSRKSMAWEPWLARAFPSMVSTCSFDFLYTLHLRKSRCMEACLIRNLAKS